MKAESKRTERISASVAWWSASVSPEKPDRMSVERAMSGQAARSRATMAWKSATE